MLTDKYRKLIEAFLEGNITADEFQDQYLSKFLKWNDNLDDELFLILNDVFESADCYWKECLPGQETGFEISEQQLRKEVHEALVRLDKWESHN
ncbi:colicin immunity domain-containing protein [Priestia filamentosa]|uniref:colicin immunity domain-containing protein n=1 Tax=Priestia filamentosa TaxID=1402861 RepID=UPI00398203F4